MASGIPGRRPPSGLTGLGYAPRSSSIPTLTGEFSRFSLDRVGPRRLVPAPRRVHNRVHTTPSHLMRVAPLVSPFVLWGGSSAVNPSTREPGRRQRPSHTLLGLASGVHGPRASKREPRTAAPRACHGWVVKDSPMGEASTMFSRCSTACRRLPFDGPRYSGSSASASGSSNG